ncbi:MAG: major capsid protein [Dehalococcoidia bacterium]
MPDLFSSDTLVGVIESLKRPQEFLLDLFFGTGDVNETSEEIHFDVRVGKRRISPFVSPLVEGKLVESLGHNTQTFKPAYVKDKRVFDPNRPLKRVAGERISGSLSPQQRIQSVLVSELQDQTEMLTRRKEVMAAEALRTGKITVVGDGFPTTVVDFLRTAGHTVTLSGASRWGQAGIVPIDDLETWMLTVLKASGAGVTDVVMDPDAWNFFINDTKTQKAIDRNLQQVNTLQIAPMVDAGGVFRGMIGNTRVWTYQDWYVDSAGVEQKMLPANTVLLGSARIEGIKHHGAIRDEDAGYQAVEFWPKSWVQNDPSVRYLMMQSAPLVVPQRPDASFAAVVA